MGKRTRADEKGQLYEQRYNISSIPFRSYIKQSQNKLITNSKRTTYEKRSKNLGDHWTE